MIWRFVNPEAERELGSHPEQVPESATLVKPGAVRQVFRAGNLFWKVAPHGGSCALSELDSAVLLAQYGIPTVEYLAGGLGENGESILITRAFPDSFSVLAYVEKEFTYGGKDGRLFRRKFVEFLRPLLDGRIFHPDFHLGNVLYSVSRDAFALVDVYKVRRANLLDRFRRYRMNRIVLELRSGVPAAEMIELLARAGIPAPEHFWRTGLVREKHAIDREWPRRERQILSGYPKFIRREGALWRSVDASGDVLPLEHCERIRLSEAGLRKQLLEHFRMQLDLVRHRRVAAVDWREGVLYREPEA